MAATKRTHNTLRHVRTVVFWLAQIQGDCPECKQPLLPNNHLSDSDDLTVDHVSGTYNHAIRIETGKCKGGKLMHRPCHKKKEIRITKPWQHR